METHFAPAERVSEATLTTEIDIVCNSEILGGVLHNMSGLLAVLNEHRQLVALNDTFMKMLGISNPEKAFGLRPGEAVNCIHARVEPGGCGTSEYCSTCGAAVAIVSAIEDEVLTERLCAMTIQTPLSTIDKAFLVKAHPINIDKRKFILLFLQDITEQQQRAALERTFFHDINNLITILVWSSELLQKKNSSDLVQSLHETSIRIQKEVAIQRCLTQQENTTYQPAWQMVSTSQIFENLQTFFTSHPTTQDKIIEIDNSFPEINFSTDLSLALRVLCNMIINALEASQGGAIIKIWTEHKEGILSFKVWNKEAIQMEISKRIFQRNFSTKEQEGRGIGTYSMKLFGEQYLGGQVSFTSSQENGTTFTFSLPA